MAVPLVDEIPIREAAHAWKKSAVLRAAVPLAEEVFGELRVAGLDLFQATIGVIAEEADDASPRLRRDTTASALKSGCSGKLTRFRSLAGVATTDETGAVINEKLAVDVSAFLAQWLPDGQASAIAPDGERLDLQAAAIREGLVRFVAVAGTAALAEDLGRLIAEHGAARDEVSKEETELTAARKTLTEAREIAAARRTTARLYLQFYLSRPGAMAIDFDKVFPARVRHSDAQAKEALDEAGADEVPAD